MRATNQLAFNDGLCRVYTVEKKTIKDELGVFNFHNETIGINAYTEFQTLGIEIEKVISIPYNTLVNNGVVVRLNDDTQYYRIQMIQVRDTFPKSLKMTLVKTPINWKEVESI